MTDKKLTDSEIVKALENEIHLAEYVDSDYCSNTEVSLLKSTIDLINRLQEKDETRHKVFETKCEELEIAEAENERLRKAIEKTDYAYFKKSCELDNLTYDFELLKQEKSVVKAEAYKEFAERLKENTDIDNKWLGKVVLEAHIDNLLKELVGE